jgi:hypothetical protein
MRRREFISLLGAAATVPPTRSRAQPQSKTYMIGLLAPARVPHVIEAFQDGLRKSGYIEGQNLKIEYRFLQGANATLDGLAAELVHLHPDVIVTLGRATQGSGEQLYPFLDRSISDDLRRPKRVVSRQTEVTYRTTNRRGWIEDDNGIAVVVVDEVPACVEHPADCDISVVVEATVGQKGDECAEGKLGEAKAAAQICSAGASQEDCTELPAPRLPK